MSKRGLWIILIWWLFSLIRNDIARAESSDFQFNGRLVNAYEVLGIDPTLPPEQLDGAVKEAWRKKAAIYHPDRNPSPSATSNLQLVNRARDMIRNADRRAAYHRYLRSIGRYQTVMKPPPPQPRSAEEPRPSQTTAKPEPQAKKFDFPEFQDDASTSGQPGQPKADAATQARHRAASAAYEKAGKSCLRSFADILIDL